MKALTTTDHAKEIELAEAACAGCNKEHAKDLARMLTGQFPGSKVDDPEVYGRMIVSEFMKIPRDAGIEVIDKLTKTCGWLPKRKDFLDAVDEIMAPRRIALARARSMRDKLEAEEKEKRDAADAADFTKRHIAEHGCTPFETLRKKLEQTATATGDKKNETTNSSKANDQGNVAD